MQPLTAASIQIVACHLQFPVTLFSHQLGALMTMTAKDGKKCVLYTEAGERELAASKQQQKQQEKHHFMRELIIN